MLKRLALACINDFRRSFLLLHLHFSLSVALPMPPYFFHLTLLLRAIQAATKNNNRNGQHVPTFCYLILHHKYYTVIIYYHFI